MIIEKCEELKYCPFCGRRPVLLNLGHRDGYDIKCFCGVKMVDLGSKEIAIKKWNRNE